jgi:hypothetical protein
VLLATNRLIGHKSFEPERKREQKNLSDPQGEAAVLLGSPDGHGLAFQPCVDCGIVPITGTYGPLQSLVEISAARLQL